ncbi:MAG: hypothetical protein D6679_03535 [Candidatus Hydrogenedentota bacterium]|nr:MAG: hypothetical protein D6679_03535 [Candidatus Hydrogenedentota bacterium]
MADVSASAAKEHVLKGSGDVGRISKDAVQVARELAQAYLADLGRGAAEEAKKARRKTIMPDDLRAAARALAPSRPETPGGLGTF